MTIENIIWLFGAYEGWDYFIQVTIFTAAVASIGLVVIIIISILGTIRTVAEGLACLLSWGRVLPPGEENEKGFTSPFLSLKSLFSKAKTKTETGEK